MPAIVICPSCNATLKPKTPLPAGARVKCPKCQNAFVVPADEADAPATPKPKPAPPKPAAAAPPPPKPKPAPPPEVEEEVAEAMDAADDEAGDGAPVAPAAGGGFKDRLKKVPMWGWIVGGVAVLFLMCGCCGVPSILYETGMLGGFGGGAVSKANLDKIKKDMTEAQVKAIMGEPSLTQPEKSGIKTDTWKGSGDDFISVGYLYDKAVSSVYQITDGPAKIKGAGLLP